MQEKEDTRALDGKEREEDTDPPRVGLRQVVGSVLAAALGVQSSRNRERDFEHGSPGVFIIAGLVFTILFIAALVTVVKLVLAAAG